MMQFISIWLWYIMLIAPVQSLSVYMAVARYVDRVSSNQMLSSIDLEHTFWVIEYWLDAADKTI